MQRNTKENRHDRKYNENTEDKKLIQWYIYKKKEIMN